MVREAECYSRFLHGDKKAIEDVIREYKDGLIFYIYSIIGDIHKSEELAVDTFIKLFTEKPNFNGDGSFKTWLYSIGRFTTVDYIRKNKNITEVPLENAYALSDDKNIEQGFIHDEEKIKLHKKISRLKPEYSQILYLIYFENFSHDETAKIMKKSRKQINDLLYRAKNALKKEIEKENEFYDEL